MALNIKKGDNVLVIAGKDKGKKGKVLTVIPADNAVVVSGVNITSKHKKPRNAQDKGGIVKAEGKINVSNVQVICPSCDKATRVASKELNGRHIRVCKHCGAALDKEAKKEVKKTAKEAAKAEKPAKAAAKVADKKAAAKPAPKKVAPKSTAKPAAKAATKTVARKSQAKGQ